MIIPQTHHPTQIVLGDLDIYLLLHQLLRSPHPSSSKDHPREGDPPHRMEGRGKGEEVDTLTSVSHVCPSIVPRDQENFLMKGTLTKHWK